MKNKLIGLAAGILLCAATVMADTYPDTLWIGNGGVFGAPILNTTTFGAELRRIDSMQAHGLAIDSNTLYVNSDLSGGPTYNLDTLAINGSFTLPNPGFDLTFSGGFIWATNFFNAIDKVNPVTGTLEGGFPRLRGRFPSALRPTGGPDSG